MVDSTSSQPKLIQIHHFVLLSKTAHATKNIDSNNDDISGSPEAVEWPLSLSGLTTIGIIHVLRSVHEPRKQVHHNTKVEVRKVIRRHQILQAQAVRGGRGESGESE